MTATKLLFNGQPIDDDWTLVSFPVKISNAVGSDYPSWPDLMGIIQDSVAAGLSEDDSWFKNVLVGYAVPRTQRAIQVEQMAYVRLYPQMTGTNTFDVCVRPTSFEIQISRLRNRIDEIDSKLIVALKEMQKFAHGKNLGRTNRSHWSEEKNIDKSYGPIFDSITGSLFSPVKGKTLKIVNPPKEDIQDLYARFDNIHDLLTSRFDVVREVWELKLTFERPTLDKGRWETVLADRTKKWSGGWEEIVPAIWNAIHDVALSIEHDVRDRFRDLSTRDSSGNITIADASHPVLRWHFWATEQVDKDSYPLVPGVYLKRLAFAEYQKNYGTKKISELTIHFHGMILPGDTLRWDSERLWFTRVWWDDTILVELKEEIPSDISETSPLWDEESVGMTPIRDIDLDAHLPQKPPFRFPYAYKKIHSTSEDTPSWTASPTKEFMMSMRIDGHTVWGEVLEEFAWQALTYHYSANTQWGYREKGWSIGTFSHGWTDFDEEVMKTITPGSSVYLKWSYVQVDDKDFSLIYSLYTEDGTSIWRWKISWKKMWWNLFARRWYPKR